VPSEEVNETTREEWRELGFYYERDDSLRHWSILGTRQGLLAFARSIREYALAPSSRQISEHIHFGPYMYLEIGTWTLPEITDHWIAGPVEALALLSESIAAAVESAEPHAPMHFRQVFAPGAPYELTLTVQPASFDPARADPACW
jgi:hypothetical protein